MLTTTPIRVIAPNRSFPRILANDVAACWWLVGRWNGNHVVEVMPLGYQFRDPSTPPTTEQVLGSGSVYHFPDCKPALVWARYALEARELYREAR